MLDHRTVVRMLRSLKNRLVLVICALLFLSASTYFDAVQPVRGQGCFPIPPPCIPHPCGCEEYGCYWDWTICACECSPIIVDPEGDGPKLRIGQTLIDVPITQTPALYPEKIIISPQGQIYLLDTELDRILLFSPKSKKLIPVSLRSTNGKLNLADLCIDSSNTFWIVDSQTNTVRAFKSNGRPLLRFHCPDYPKSVGVLENGDIVVQTGTGSHLFAMYTRKGVLIKSFGERKPAASKGGDYWLNHGWMAVRGNDIYFCFAYPYEIRRYDSQGSLVWSHTIPLDMPKPIIRGQGDSMSVSMSFSSLAIATDRRNRVYVLVSGAPQLMALNKGSDRLDIVSSAGIVASYSLAQSYNSIGVARGQALALKNRKVLRIDAYDVTW